MDAHYYSEPITTIYHGDAFSVVPSLPPDSVQAIITSPPYWGLRLYDGVPARTWSENDAAPWSGHFGLETIHDCNGWATGAFCNACYVCHSLVMFEQLWRVLRDDGVVFWNISDSYIGRMSRASVNHRAGFIPEYREGAVQRRSRGLKFKDMAGVPWRVALAAQSAGWYLRSDIIWSKPNPMPESVTDRPTKSHEYIFMLTKNGKYFYNADAIRETNETGTGHNKRSVWQIATRGFLDAHFATFPVGLATPCVLAASSELDTVLDPFAGSGTTGVVAKQKNRQAILIDANVEYCAMMKTRIMETQPALFS